MSSATVPISGRSASNLAVTGGSDCCNAKTGRKTAGNALAMGSAQGTLSSASRGLEMTMAKGYWVVRYRSVSDPEARDAYAELAGPAVIAAGGDF
jgi:hypothetical protein